MIRSCFFFLRLRAEATGFQQLSGFGLGMKAPLDQQSGENLRGPMPTPKKYIRLDKGLGLAHIQGIFFRDSEGIMVGNISPFTSGRLVLRAGGWQQLGP